MSHQKGGFIKFVVLVVIIIVLLFIFKVDLKTPLQNAWNKVREFSTGESFDGIGKDLQERKEKINNEIEN